MTMLDINALEGLCVCDSMSLFGQCSWWRVWRLISQKRFHPIVEEKTKPLGSFDFSLEFMTPYEFDCSWAQEQQAQNRSLNLEFTPNKAAVQCCTQVALSGKRINLKHYLGVNLKHIFSVNLKHNLGVNSQHIFSGCLKYSRIQGQHPDTAPKPRRTQRLTTWLSYPIVRNYESFQLNFCWFLASKNIPWRSKTYY